MQRIAIKNNLNTEFSIQHKDNEEAISIDSKDLSKVKSVDTISYLKSLTSTPPTVWVSGYHTKSDGAFGSHIFEWDSTSTEDDNGGTIIKLDNVGTGRYKLRFDGAVNIKWFGAKGDFADSTLGYTDNYNAISKALLSMHSGEKLFFPDGRYASSGNIEIDKTITIEMESSDISSSIVFVSVIPKTVQTTVIHPNDGQDNPISAGITINAHSVELINVISELYCDYTDLSPTNFGIDNDVGFFVKSKARTIFRTCRSRGYWRKAGVLLDATEIEGTADRTTFYDCRFQGFWGLEIKGIDAEIGQTEIASDDNRGSGGISDLNAVRTWFMGWSHHSKIRGSDTDGGCYHVDGKLYKGTSEVDAIQGRVFNNCRFDGAEPYLIKIENAIRDKFISCFVDRKSGYLKTDGVTGVGTPDCLLSMADGSRVVRFENTDIYRTTIDYTSLSDFTIHNGRDENLNSIESNVRTFLPALAYGTNITYNLRSGSYTVTDSLIKFTFKIDVSNSDNSDNSQVQIAGLDSILNGEVLSANIDMLLSTFITSPEIAIVAKLNDSTIGLWKSTGGTLRYSDCDTSGVLVIQGTLMK